MRDDPAPDPPADGSGPPAGAGGGSDGAAGPPLPAPPREVCLRVAPDVMRLPEVRGLLRRLLAAWELEDRVAAGDLELLATEVLTNAIRHTRSAATVVVRWTGAVVRVEVADDASTPPRLQPLDVDREGGRGVFLVDRMASSWGVSASGGGKRVWFEVPVAPR